MSQPHWGCSSLQCYIQKAYCNIFFTSFKLIRAAAIVTRIQISVQKVKACLGSPIVTGHTDSRWKGSYPAQASEYNLNDPVIISVNRGVDKGNVLILAQLNYRIYWRITTGGNNVCVLYTDSCCLWGEEEGRAPPDYTQPRSPVYPALDRCSVYHRSWATRQDCVWLSTGYTGDRGSV